MVDNAIEGDWSGSHLREQARPFGAIEIRLVGLCLLLAFAFALIRPPYAFSIDDMIYVEMARAFWQESALHIAETGGLSGAPELILKLTHGIDGKVYPQYPGLYGVLAAPFYGLAGVRGLVFLNAASFFACLWLTQRIVRHLYGAALDRRWVALLLAVGSFMPVYAFGIWPHLLALAFVLAGVERACAHFGRKDAPRSLDLLLSGLWLGLAIAIRVDSLMPAVAVVAWMALMGAPSKRIAPILLVLGMVPFLAVSGYLNHMKFGTYWPISYGPKSGPDGVSNYAPLLAGLGGALLVACLVDPSRGAIRGALDWLRRPMPLAFVLIGAGTVIAAVPLFSKIAWNAYVLVVDLQQLDGEQITGATNVDSDGFINILGIHKKSLVQSLPFVGLALVTLGGLISGRRVATRGLGWMVIAATVGFYSLTQWHGGYSFDMRYFLPALPFLAILSVDGFTSLCLGVSGKARRSGLVIGAFLGAGIFAWIYFGLEPEAHATLTLPLIVAAVAAVITLLVAANRSGFGLRRTWVAVCGAAFMLGILATGGDLIGQHERLAKYGPVTKAAAGAFPEGSLVVTGIEEHFLLTPDSGVNLVSASRYSGQVARAALAAFRADRRCVYVHTLNTLTDLGPEVDGDWTPVTLPGLSGEGATLYQPDYQAETCPLN